jgi:hypothetical protein
MRQLVKRTRRTITEEIKIALEEYFKKNGMPLEENP